MQFQVPQFIEAEPRIVGPLTLKQFLYLGAAAALLFVGFFVFTFPLFLGIASIFGGAAAALAFGKVNGRPLPILARRAFAYFLKPRLYLWLREGEAPAAAPPSPRGEGALRNLFFALLTTTKPIAAREKASRPLRPFGAREPQPRWQLLRHTTGERESARRVDYR